MPDHDVLSVHEAAESLGVSMPRIRQMIHAGQLSAWRSSAGWLIPAEAVEERSRNAFTGRPPAPQTAWSAIALLSAAVTPGLRPLSGLAVPVSDVIPDRRSRQRVLRMLASLPDPVADPEPWRRLMSARGKVRRLWVHPGVLDRLAVDSRVSRGGVEATPAGHDGLTVRPDRLELYASEADEECLIRQYRMRDDSKGQVHLVVMPSNVPPKLAPGGGAPVAVPAAACDLLDEEDPRARHAAALDLKACLDALRGTGLLTGTSGIPDSSA
jgi:excisionase family DNA binding protein